MSIRPVLDFSSLNAPADHGQVLVLPSPEHLPGLVEGNRRLLAGHEFPVLDVSSFDCRSIARQAFCPALVDRPWIVTGHQPEFIHPGVWAKHVVTQRLADHVDGVPANIIVDHDVAKDVALAVPTHQDSRFRKAHIAFAPYQPGLPWELLEPLPPGQIADFAARVRAAYGPRYAGSLMEVFFAAAEQVSDPHAWIDQKTAGRRAIDAMFSIRLVESAARRVWGGPFLARMLIDAERFTACYNHALHQYRRMLNIRGVFHPIPDLIRRGDHLELPIWAVRPGKPRQRVFLSRTADRIDLFAESDAIGSFRADDLRRWDTAQEALAAGLAAGIRPRALTLTLWARLFLADVFVHGIGGAKYDRITDILIRDYFDIEPPGICCVSATLRLDLPSPTISAADLRNMDRRLRDLRHNPQRHLPSAPQLESLLATKTDLVAQSDWLREHEPSKRSTRREVFDRIHEVNQRMLHLEPNIAAGLEQEHRQLADALSQAAVLRDREYFIGLFRRSDLQFLCDMLPRF